MVYIVSSNEVNPRAQTSETLHFYYLSILSSWMERTQYTPTAIEWNLMHDAYDEKYKRRADMGFLFGFVIAQTLRGPGKRRWFTSRSLYSGLVGYDVALSDINPCPSMNCWNSMVMLDTPLGQVARMIYSPKIFHQCPNTSSLFSPLQPAKAGEAPATTRSVVTHNAWLITKSLLLMNVMSAFFEGSLWQSPSSIRSRFPLTPDAVGVSPSNSVSGTNISARELAPINDPTGKGRQVHRTFALVMNFRSLRWSPIMTTYLQLSDANHEYGFVCTPIPVIPEERRELWGATLDCAADALCGNSRFIAGAWWWVHSLAMTYVLSPPSS
jgi:hypothetical protein